MKVTVDKKLCTGDALCLALCPEVFELNEDMQAEVLLTPVPEEHQAACREAVDACPEECITIED
ncbi:MAG: ferredoxin [bacterium]